MSTPHIWTLVGGMLPGAAEPAHVPLIAYGNYCTGMEGKVDGALWLGDTETCSWKAQLYSLQPSLHPFELLGCPHHGVSVPG